MTKKLFLLGIILMVTALECFAQAPTVTLEIQPGESDNICEGSQTEILITITPPASDPNRTYGFQLKNFPESEYPIMQFPDLEGQEGDDGGSFITNGNSANDQDSFLIVTPTENTRYRIEVFGQFRVIRTISIDVEEIPNAGFDTEIFLCGRNSDFNLFDELDGFPDMGGTWSNTSGVYNISDPNGGVFTYTITTPGPCPDQVSILTVKPCGNNDIDNDTIPNDIDLDDDGDGILDSVEDGFCNSAGGLTPIFILEEDFGFGDTPVRSRFVEGGTGLTFNPGLPQDTTPGTFGEYSVANSSYYNNQLGGIFLATTGNIDANGDIDGRYLAINMKSSQFDEENPVFRVRGLPVTPNIEYTLSMSVANTDGSGGIPPHLRIDIVDANNPTSTPIRSIDTGDITITDIWQLFEDSFTISAISGISIVDIEVINLQPSDDLGNDLGIDNIFLSRQQCDFDRDGIPNSQDLDSDNDGIYDFIENGGNASNDLNGDGRADTTVNLSVVSSPDTDSQPDFLDIDSDGDGIIDNIEAQTTSNYIAPVGIDSNFNGVDDAYDNLGTPIIPVTTVAGNPDYLNTNTDNDCLGDTIEAYDTDRDGILNNGETTFIPNTDSDGDGLNDGFDNVVLDRLSENTNATNGQNIDAFLNNRNPETAEKDWREEFTDIPAIALSIGTLNCDPVDLFDTISTLYTNAEATPPINGTWETPGTADLGGTPAYLGNLDPTDFNNIDGDYIYTIPAFNGSNGTCPEQTITLTVTIDPRCKCPTIAAPIKVGTDPTICIDAITLPTLEVNPPPAIPAGLIVRWFEADGTTLLLNDNVSYPLVRANIIVGNTTIRAQYYDPVRMCFGEFVDFIVTGTTAPDAGTGPTTALQFCDMGTVSSTSLFSLLTSADAGGTWTSPSNTNLGTSFTDTNVENGDYVYTLTSNGCTDNATVEVEINNNPTPTAPTLDPSYCGSFTLPALAANQKYFTATGGTGNELFVGEDITASQTVFIQEISSQNCIGETSFTITIDPTTGNTGTNGTLRSCQNGTSVSLFSLLGGNPTANGQWIAPDDSVFDTTNIGNFDPMTNTAGTYTYRINAVGACPLSESTVEVTVDPLPNPTAPLIASTFCRTANIPEYTNTNQRYFTGPNGSGLEVFPGDTINQTSTIYLRESNSNCTSEIDFTITIETPPIITLNELEGVCFDNNGVISEPVLIEAPVELDPATYSFQWIFNNAPIPGETNSSISANRIGFYSLRYGIKSNPSCFEISNRVNLKNQENAEIIDIQKEGRSVRIIADGDNLEYSINGSSFQRSNFFRRIAFGEFTVTVHNQCLEVTETGILFGFPEFFTPNQDGENDLWNVQGAVTNDIVISIFDRYGSIIVVFNPLDPGWDGRYDSNDMPGDDYWYHAVRSNGEEYRGHFSLVR